MDNSIIEQKSSSSNEVVTQAIRLAKFGFSIFPCKPDKSPLTKRGFKDSTSDLEQIESWWSHYPDALVGVATGEKSNIVVLDIDPRNGGDTWLEENIENIPQTLSYKTQSGGRHFVFKHPGGLIKSTANKIARGVDVRGDGGYAIFWPAAGYEANSIEVLASWPDWIDSATTENFIPLPPEDLLASDIDSLAIIVRQIPNEIDDRNSWVGVGHALKAAFAEAPGLAEELFLDFSARYTGPIIEGEAEKAYESALPPHKCGAQYLVSLAVDAGIDVSAYSLACAQKVFTAEPRQVYARFQPKFLSEIDLTPKPELIKGWIGQNEFGALIGPPSGGKTTIAAEMAVAIATGGSWMGRPAQMGAVIFIEAEGTVGAAKRLLAAGATKDTSRIALIDDDFTMGDDAARQALIEAIKRHQECLDVPLQAIFIDTLARTSEGLDENTSVDMGKIVAFCKALQKHTNAAVIILHHTGLTASDRARGSSALRGALDAEILVSKDGQTGISKISANKMREREMPRSISFKIDRVTLAGGESAPKAVAVDPGTVQTMIKSDTGAAGVLQIIQNAGGEMLADTAREAFLKTYQGQSASGRRAFNRGIEKLVQEGLAVKDQQYLRLPGIKAGTIEALLQGAQ